MATRGCRVSPSRAPVLSFAQRLLRRLALSVWTNSGKHFVVRLVMRLKYKEGQKTHYVSGRSFQFELRLERRTMEVLRLEA